jgi:hypothetical protein
VPINLMDRDVRELRATVFGGHGEPGLKTKVERHEILLDQFVKMKYMIIAQLFTTLGAIVLAAIMFFTKIQQGSQ